MKMGQFLHHLLLMDHDGVQTSAAKGMEVEPSMYENLSQVSALRKTENNNG